MSKALLSRWPNTPKVELITTDGFLLPNRALEEAGLMDKKGFPESYDNRALVRFLSDVKAGRRNVEAPVYPHLVDDVLPDEKTVVDRPDILIVEGVNVLLAPRPPRDGRARPLVSDFFDFSVYLDADDALEEWYVERFQRLRQTAFRDPRFISALMRRSTRRKPTRSQRTSGVASIWRTCARTSRRPARARVRPDQGADHLVSEVALRKL